MLLQAQNENEAVKKVINKMFQGMKEGDSAKVHSVFSDKVLMQTIASDRDGNVQVSTGDLSAFLNALGTPHADIWDERIEFEEVKVDGPLASVWTPYQFFRGTTFSHCGVNSFQLTKEGKDWKIVYLIDTRRKDNCK
jgi:hypothetical protein